MIRCSKKKSINFLAKKGYLGDGFDKVYGIPRKITSVKKYLMMLLKRRFILSVKSLSIWFCGIEINGNFTSIAMRVITF